MKKIISLSFVLLLAMFLVVGCNNDDENNGLSEHINGEITATIHYPDGSTYNFVADTVAIAYLSPANDSLLILGIDRNQRVVSILLDNASNIAEGETLTPENVTGELGFMSYYQDYSGFPYILQVGTNGQYGEDDRLTIDELNTSDQMISGTFELTTYPAMIDEFDGSAAIRISNGQFSLNYFNSAEQMQAYNGSLPEPEPSTVQSSITFSVTTTNNLLTIENQTISENGTMGTLAPTAPTNIFALVVDIGNNYWLNLSCLPQIGTQSITEIGDQAGFYIVNSSVSMFANEGSFSITEFDTENHHVVGSYAASGFLLNPTNPDEEVYFTSSGSFNVYYP